MNINLRRPDYHKYRWKKGEKAGIFVICAGATGFLAYFFYRSLWAAIPLSGIGIMLFLRISGQRMKRAKEELAVQFRECILATATSLQAGYSVENAFVEAGKDMRLMYGDEAAIVEELNIIRRGLNINITLEELLTDMAERSACEDILQFAEIFSIAKRNGGNMTEIIHSTAAQIGKQIELRQEIQILLSGKKMELGIMKGMPFGILLYVNFGNPGYFDPLYHNLTGIAVMTGCLGVYLGAYVLGEKILDGLM